MSTHNIGFCGEIRKILTRYPLLSRPMKTCSRGHSTFFLFFIITISLDISNSAWIHRKCQDLLSMKNKKNK